MNIVGINAFHADAAACLIVDGGLVAAAEEERFQRQKHYAGFPGDALSYCLAEGRITLADVDHIAINQDSSSHLWRKLGYTLVHRPNPRLVIERLRNRKAREGIREHLSEAIPDQQFSGEVHSIEHHKAHLYSAFHVSPFHDASVVSVDGFGDFSSAAWGHGAGTKIDIQHRIYFPHSLGIFYQAITQYLGFPHYGDEYKVMGLAPYGRPTLLDEMRQIVHVDKIGCFKLDLTFFRHHQENVAFEWQSGVPTFGTIFASELEKLLGPARDPAEPLTQRHKDIARSTQAMYEEAFMAILRSAHAAHPTDSLAIAGGCGMNSVANGKITRASPYRRVYVQAAAGDSGGAIGAALAVWHDALGNSERFTMRHAYWGPSFDAIEIRQLVGNHRDILVKEGCSIDEFDDSVLCQETARAVAEGNVVGWFQGRMEWGPRALGNRSILCDPRRGDMKSVLNNKIKRRESFRPFAPSILRESVIEWFEDQDDVPFMAQVFQIRSEKRALIPAVTHVDGSGRLQTVHRDTNPLYYQLIEAFRDITGIPIILNTSLNENEPVVCRPEEALACFLRTKMDVLVLGNLLVRRQPERQREREHNRSKGRV